MAGTDGEGLVRMFEMSRPLIEPTLRLLKIANTMLDVLFYDVNVMMSELFSRGSIIVAGPDNFVSSRLSEMTQAFSCLDLGAMSNPEGSILVVDAGRPPHVRRFEDVQAFLNWAERMPDSVRAISITGMGSSALGSASFAWNISAALDRPVAAIVPGYGFADVILQLFEGCFGIGRHTWWIKQVAQQVLAHAIPSIAHIGYKLIMSSPRHTEASSGAPLFPRGSDASEVLNTVLSELNGIHHLYGHSKGALAIAHAIADLPKDATDRLHIVTFGCPIAEDVRMASYLQFLGLFDAIGWFNAWGNFPEMAILAHHSTNTRIPLSMPVTLLTHIAEVQESVFAQSRLTVPQTKTVQLRPSQ